jgi:hypothetical protein
MTTTAINKSTIIENIWHNFYDRLKAQVTTTTITGSVTVTIQRYDNSYSDEDFNTKSNLPILIVETPLIDIKPLTFGKSEARGTINIEIYTTQSESADNFSSKILDAIETYKGDYAKVGLKDIQVENTDTDFVERSGIKIHVRRVRFSFVYYYNKTRAF